MQVYFVRAKLLVYVVRTVVNAIFDFMTERILGRVKYCLVPRRLSLDENARAKEGFSWYLAVHHQSLWQSLYLAKNEAPEEEAGKNSNP